jgi:hypothetical protein
MRKYIDIRVIALDDEVLGEFLIALRKMQWCGDAGAGRKLPIVIDGDGAGQLNFEIIEDGKNTNIRELVTLNEKALKKVSDGDDFETHYIGE